MGYLEAAAEVLNIMMEEGMRLEMYMEVKCCHCMLVGACW